MLSKYMNLSYVPRWVIVPMMRHQSVSDHSWRVAMIADALSKALGVDPHPCVYCAMKHDVGEVFTGDTPSTEKSAPEFSKMTDVALIVKVADYIETLTWADLWAHPGAKTDVIASVRGRFASALRELDIRFFNRASEEALNIEREVVHGRQDQVY